MTEPSGLCYLLLEPELKRIKIGFSSVDVRNRVKGFQTGNSQLLRLLAVIPGGRSVERHLHARFARYRILDRAEWFDASDGAMMDDVAAAIDELNGVRL